MFDSDDNGSRFDFGWHDGRPGRSAYGRLCLRGGTERIARIATMVLRQSAPQHAGPQHAAPAPRPGRAESLPAPAIGGSPHRHDQARRVPPVPRLPEGGECRLDPAGFDALRRRFPWALDQIAVIEADLLAADRRRLGPYLLSGPAGIGKSEFATGLCRMLGARWTHIAAATAAANCLTVSAASPVEQLIAETGIVNPIVVVDDLDRIRPQSRLAGALTALADRWSLDNRGLARSARETTLAKVSWIAVAADPGGLPRSLRDVFTPIRFPAPRLQDAPSLIVALWRETLAGRDAHGLVDLPAQDEIVAIAGLWQTTGAPSIRPLRRIVQRWIARRDRAAIRH